jgi:hypothetical protein
VDADAVLARLPEEEWFVGSSADHREKLRADEWAIYRFGMTTTMRLRTGECKGMGGVDEAMAHLLTKVQWNTVHIRDAIRTLTNSQVVELPRVAEHFADFVEHIQNFQAENRAVELVLAAASIWRIAEHVPPRQRHSIIYALMRVLTVLGLTKDALAMRKRYMDVYDDAFIGRSVLAGWIYCRSPECSDLHFGIKEAPAFTFMLPCPIRTAGGCAYPFNPLGQ